MKLTKKLRYLFSLASLLVCLCMGSVCVYADSSAEVMPYVMEEETTTSAEDAKTYANGKITYGEIKSLVEQYVSAIAQYSGCSYEELSYIADATASQTDVYANFAKIVGEDGCGAYSSYDKIEVVDLGEGKLEVTTDIHFEKKDIKMSLNVSCFDTIGPQITSTAFTLADEGNETFGAKMATAASNTLIGMGVVFCVLIFISLIIYCFGFIPKIMAKIENRNNSKQEVQVSPAADAPVVVNSAEEDNTELIAVIAAAIAASEQTSTDSFVVRSIRRR